MAARSMLLREERTWTSPTLVTLLWEPRRRSRRVEPLRPGPVMKTTVKSESAVEADHRITGACSNDNSDFPSPADAVTIGLDSTF